MASIKISELNELTDYESNDIMPVVDTSANETKKIKMNNLVVDTYSTNETKTNKIWIDGKHIYRKVINVSSLTPTGDTLTIAHGINNLGLIVNINCIANNSIDNYFDFKNYTWKVYGQNYWSSLHVSADATNIYCVYDGSESINYVSDAYFILEYTKSN